MPSLVGRRPVQHRLVGHQLQIQVERRIHLQPRALHLFRAILLLQLLPHLLHKVRRNRVGRRLNLQPQRSRFGLLLLFARNLPVRQHLAQHQVAPLQRPLRVVDRRVGLRALGQRRQQRRLRQRQIAHMLAEVILRRRLKPIRPVPQIDLVGIQRKDLVLGEHALDLHRQQYLLQLAPIRLLVGQKQIPRQLHGQRGRALRPAARVQVPPRRAHRPHQVHSPVPLERLVLNREQRLPQHRRERRIRHHPPPLQRERPNLPPTDVQQFGRRARSISRQLVHLRQVDRVHQHQPAHHPKHRGQPQQHRERRPRCKVPRAVRRSMQHIAPAQPAPPPPLPRLRELLLVTV